MSGHNCGMVLVSLFTCARLSAGVITLDLLDPAGVTGTAGDAFEAGDSFTTAGVTFSAAASTSLGAMTGSYSANATTAGINSDGILDAPSELDVGERLAFTLTFDDAAFSVELQTVDFSGIGGTTDDSARVTTTAGTFTLFTGQPNFNGSTDVWSPIGLVFATGDTIEVHASGLANNVALQAMSFDITTISVPEPTAFPALLCLSASVVAVAGLRRK